MQSSNLIERANALQSIASDIAVSPHVVIIAAIFASVAVASYLSKHL